MSNQEEATGQTQDMLKGLYLLAGLGIPLCFPGKAGGGGQGEGNLGFSAKFLAELEGQFTL